MLASDYQETSAQASKTGFEGKGIGDVTFSAVELTVRGASNPDSLFGEKGGKGYPIARAGGALGNLGPGNTTTRWSNPPSSSHIVTERNTKYRGFVLVRGINNSSWKDRAISAYFSSTTVQSSRRTAQKQKCCKLNYAISRMMRFYCTLGPGIIMVHKAESGSPASVVVQLLHIGMRQALCKEHRSRRRW